MERNLGGMSENRLYDAATRGDERSLEELLEQDPLLLHRVSYTCSNKTPLHVATIHGHLPFVQAILNHNPDLAQELDSHESSALHVASSKGYLEISRELLSAAPDMCLSLDSRGRNPLHLAAMKGHVEVLAELVRLAPFAARVKLDRGMTMLHLCVEHRQLKALKILVHNMNELVNAKNDDGDTVLHMAVRDRKIEIVNFLLTVSALEVNALNLNGLTPSNVLSQSRRDVRDSEIEEALKHAGGFSTLETNRQPLYINQNIVAPRASPPYNLDNEQKNSLETLLKRQDAWLEKKRSALMVVASLIATMAFQIGINPPSGVWQEDNLVNSQRAGFSLLGFSVQATNYPGKYTLFYTINTTSFIASLSIILLLMSGLPLRRKFFMWILMVITWIAITATALTYSVSIMILTLNVAPQEPNPVWRMIGLSIIVWLCLMALLLIGHTVRLVVKVVRKLRKMSWRRRRVGAFVERKN